MVAPAAVTMTGPLRAWEPLLELMTAGRAALPRARVPAPARVNGLAGLSKTMTPTFLAEARVTTGLTVKTGPPDPPKVTMAWSASGIVELVQFEAVSQSPLASTFQVTTGAVLGTKTNSEAERAMLLMRTSSREPVKVSALEAPRPSFPMTKGPWMAPLVAPSAVGVPTGLAAVMVGSTLVQ